MIESAIRFLDAFFEEHTFVKSSARALVVAVITAILMELGLGEVAQTVTP